MMHLSSSRDPRNDSPVRVASSAAQHIGSSAAQAARDVGDVASREAEQIGSAVRDWWLQRRDGALQTVDQARQGAYAVGERTQDYVRQAPMKSLLGAVALGALLAAIALLVSRREP
jgi:ElaB/YqjD/DUF883 family membrane-anchored ribosome-binding protein